MGFRIELDFDPCSPTCGSLITYTYIYIRNIFVLILILYLFMYLLFCMSRCRDGFWDLWPYIAILPIQFLHIRCWRAFSCVTLNNEALKAGAEPSLRPQNGRLHAVTFSVPRRQLPNPCYLVGPRRKVTISPRKCPLWPNAI